jgi:hypothetical protein
MRLIPAFLSYDAENKNVNYFWQGVIISGLPIGCILYNFWLSKYIQTMEIRNIVYFGIILQTLNSSIFGTLEFVQNEYLYIIIGFISRILLGIGRNAFGIGSLTYL